MVVGMRKLQPARKTGYQGFTHKRTRTIAVGRGLPDVADMQAELDEYLDVLMGREDAPVEGLMALFETADMYYARASEMDMMILRGEADGSIAKGSPHSKFRTGELRTFRELAKRAADLGSRRLTAITAEFERSRLGRETR
jgi:hypothetical protein